MAIAMLIPPPMHNEARPRLLFSLNIICNNVTNILAPDAPVKLIKNLN